MMKTMRIERQKDISQDDDRCDDKDEDDDSDDDDENDDSDEEEFTLLQLGLVAVGSQSDSDVGSNEESEERKNLLQGESELSEEKFEFD